MQYTVYIQNSVYVCIAYFNSEDRETGEGRRLRISYSIKTSENVECIRIRCILVPVRILIAFLSTDASLKRLN